MADHCLDQWRSVIAVAHGMFEKTPDELIGPVQLKLMARREYWKAEAFKRSTAEELRLVMNPMPEPTTVILIDDPDAVIEESVIADRAHMLADYKRATGDPSNKAIYESRNSGIYKPEFYKWLRGELESDSVTAINFEKFLRLKKRPIPRQPTD